MNKLNLLTLILFSLFFTQQAIAQESSVSGQVLDKIVAKVDNNILLESDVQKTFLEAVAQSQQGMTPPSRCDVFETLLINKLMVAKAEIDSVIVTEAEVMLQADNRFNMVLQQIGGDENTLLQVYGKTAEQLKNEIYDVMKEQLTVQRMRDKITQGLTVSPAEVRSFFQSIPQDSLPFFSAEVTVGQIVKKPEVNPQVKENIYNQLKQFKEDILAGRADFADLARRYSEDPGSGAQGGDLGFFRRGELAPEYEATALSLRQGEISDPVETQFGFHMIQLLENKGGSYNTRHILRIPQATEDDIKKTERYLDSLKTEIEAGRLEFAKAAKDYSDDRNTSDNGGFFTDPGTSSNRLTLRTLEDPVLYFTIDSMKVGSISKPIRFEDPREGTKVRILYYKAKYPAHRANLNDDYEKMKAAALRKKEDEILSTWFVTAKEDVFIDIDPAYDRCNALVEKK
ncbi:MAG TPA: peptidylprolyl isomerase [Algoriphagus sp.]|jgi:peptidyl-prolyl cis-trans isomerase SurA|uniref:peptidylprolyl isomerase n=2 Tax=Algoriphagus TaxID=246875 RepID=UPI000C61C140|nr:MULTISPECIES: peptidylprolyl isomerase [unclassified Algoriphagus]MAL12341.1 peptidylprolyl isomerase [Algoriphagus sp.]QYH40194.1 peptidylprolyl isomerase [Algoriphagus sp. NBT04N3]HAD49977.1 peptidylprolyl isomerase [Algoriphagus sp.]HAH37381.1 peptidylprolyl isomerase [Algoriphagus sp.]HCB45752.1 peptidylprolyl isomerase [Algoriphagus sp.]|tara:strand:- start:112 stop:1479 length:1368 start_codon:yes stop_codon:yes gene_type:complete